MQSCTKILFGLQRPLHTGVEYADSECQVKILLSCWGENGLPTIACLNESGNLRLKLNLLGGMELGALACASLWQPDGLVKWTEVP